MQRTRQLLAHDRQIFEEESKLLNETREQWEEIRRQADEHHDDQTDKLLTAQREIERLSHSLLQSQRQAADAAESLEKLQAEHEAVKQTLAQTTAAGAVDEATLAEFNRERAEFTKQIRNLESQLAEATKQLAERPEPADVSRTEDLQRRFEMAVDDVRSLKREKAVLEEELAELKTQSARPASSGAAVGEDWESTKRRLLAQLEGDEDLPAAQRMSEDDRLSVEGAIRITDDMVQQRDREIAELKQQLAQQGDSSAAEPSSAQAVEVARVLDQDAVIKEERQRLLQMQQEWQDKLRQAEVEISVQRARIARERNDVDEKLRVLEDHKSMLAAQQTSGEAPSTNKPQKPARRWLTRMGLKENDKD